MEQQRPVNAVQLPDNEYETPKQSNRQRSIDVQSPVKEKIVRW